MKMKTVLLDDELPAIDLLKRFAKKIPFLDIQLASTDAFEVMDWLNAHSVDLLFTDIEMPDMSGLELVKAIRQPPMVVFTTAYEDFALESYELDVLDYLVKPIRFERFLQSVNKARRLYMLENRAAAETTGVLQIKVDYKTINVPFEDILYIEGLKDYVKVFTKGKMYLTRLNVKSMEQKLPEALFLRVHRSYVVALSKVSSFQKSQLSVGENVIPIGASYQEAVSERLG